MTAGLLDPARRRMASAMRAADPEAKVHDRDPRGTEDSSAWEERFLAGGHVRCLFVESAAMRHRPLQADEADAVLVGYREWTDGGDAEAQDWLAAVGRSVQDSIPEVAEVLPVSLDVVRSEETGRAGGPLLFKGILAVRFFAPPCED